MDFATGWLLDPQIQAHIFGTQCEVQLGSFGSLVGGAFDAPRLTRTGTAPVIAIPQAQLPALARLDAALGVVERDGVRIHGVHDARTGAEAADVAELWSLEAAAPALPSIRAGVDAFLRAPGLVPGTEPGALMGARMRAWSQELAAGLPQARDDHPDPQRVDIHARTHAHFGFFATEVVQMQYPRFDGHMSPPLRREVFQAPHAALVLPYDPVLDCVLLIDQFRIAPVMAGGLPAWSLEPIAGLVDPGEQPEVAARRECLEEAQLNLRDLRPIPPSLPSPGNLTTIYYSYIAICDLSQYRSQIAGLQSEAEDIRSRIIPFDQAMQMVRSGEICVTPLVTMMLWLAQDRPALRG